MVFVTQHGGWPMPIARAVVLTVEARERLESLGRAGSTPQALAFRCRLIVRAADDDQPADLQIAAEFDCDRHTVGVWRNRYLDQGLAGLQDAPRPGRPRVFPPCGSHRSRDHRFGKHGGT
jgi:hypothetical protein